jgi:hypothetical protein
MEILEKPLILSEISRCGNPQPISLGEKKMGRQRESEVISGMEFTSGHDAGVEHLEHIISDVSRRGYSY